MSPLEGTVLCDVAVLPTVAKTGLLVTELRQGKRVSAEAVITSPSPKRQVPAGREAREALDEATAYSKPGIL